MLLIDYTPVDFPDENLSGSNSLRCTWADVVWAAMTAGHKQTQLTIRPQAYAYLELCHRINSVYTHLQAADYRPGLWGAMDTHLIQSPIYHELGPAGKSTVSTFVGFIAGKLFAVRLLHVPWLFKIDAYSRTSNAIGLDKEFQWTAMGVKGRSNRLEQRLIKKAAKMTQQAAIGGIPPQQQVAFFSYFTAVSKTLKAYLVNLPLAVRSSNLNLDIAPDTFLRTYYALIFDFLSTGYGGNGFTEVYKNQTYRIKAIPEVEVQVGLNEKIYQLMQTTDDRFPRKMLSDLVEATPQDQTETRIMIGSDGVLTRLGEAWGENKMHLPPQERNK